MRHGGLALADRRLEITAARRSLWRGGDQRQEPEAHWIAERLEGQRELVGVDESGTCCFAKQDKVWVDGPDGAWEIYTVLEDTDAFGQSSVKVDDQTGDSLCCGRAPTASTPEAEARCG